MIKVGTTKDIERIVNILPIDVIGKCLEVTNVLDNEYGAYRSIDTDMGGFIAIIEGVEDIKILEQCHNLDMVEDIAESVEVINAPNDSYLSILYMLSSDYGINVVADRKILPLELLKKLEV